MADESFTLHKRQAVEHALTICRVKSGAIVISARRGDQRILFDISQEEFNDFITRVRRLESRAVADKEALGLR